MFCKKCGNQINSGESFCGNCGERVVDNTSNQVNPTPIPNNNDTVEKPYTVPNNNESVSPTFVDNNTTNQVEQSDQINNNLGTSEVSLSSFTTNKDAAKNNNSVVLFIIIGVLCILIALVGVFLFYKNKTHDNIINDKPSTSKIINNDNSSTTTTTKSATNEPTTTKGSSSSSDVDLSDLFCNAFKINDTVIKLPASYDTFKALGFELPSDKLNNVINPNSGATMTLTDKNSNRLIVIFANTTSEIVKAIDAKITYITIKSSTSVKYTLPGNLTFDATADQIRNTFKKYKPIYDKAVVKGADNIQYRSDDVNRYSVHFNFNNNKLYEVSIIYLF